MDKSTEQESGRFAEVQALQAEDGTFELVVSESASHPAVSEEMARRHREPQAPDAPVDAPLGVGRKRAALIVLLVALVGGGALFALSGSDEPDAESAPAVRASNDGFQPYAGGGGAAGSARSFQAEADERLKAAAAAEGQGERFSNPRPQPVEVRAFAKPDEELSDEELSDEELWELNEAELLEEARAVELAEEAEEAAAQAQAEEQADLEPEQPAAPPPEDAEVAPQPLDIRSREKIQLHNQGVLVPDAQRSRAPVRIERPQVRPARRPPLRGLRGLQRRTAQPEPVDEGAWEESDEYQDDRVPEFGRD